MDEEILVGCPARRGCENVRFVLLNPENFGKAADIQRRHSAPVEERLMAVGIGEAANLVAAARVKINDGAAHRSSVAVDRDDDVADCGDGQRADRLRRVVVRFADDGADRLPDQLSVQLQQPLAGEVHRVFPIGLRRDLRALVEYDGLAAGGAHVDAHKPHSVPLLSS